MDPLHRLAELRGVETSYHDVQGRRWDTSDEDLFRLLVALGAPMHRPQDGLDALRAEMWARSSRVLPPAQVIWSDRTPQVSFRANAAAAFGRFELRVGDEPPVSGRVEALPSRAGPDVEGHRFVDFTVDLPRMPEAGYHDIHLEWNGRAHAGWTICAPSRFPQPGGQWGVFVPTYALRTQDDLGVGTLGHLERLSELVCSHGASVIATLPLLATFLDHPFEPSPYSPVSRRFWNELFLDLKRLPELETVGWSEVAERTRDLRALAEVDHRTVYAQLRPILQQAADAAHAGPLRERIDAWSRTCPEAETYARFRARVEAEGKVWHLWETPEVLDERLTEHPAYRLHRWAQFRMDGQLEALRARLGEREAGLYLDLPLGVHPDGYDAWADRQLFVPGFSVGAPPDALAPEGQDWGFRPLHPEAIRDVRYGPWIECVRRHCSVATMLRIDHVMGLHRLFWVPSERGATSGTYVRMNADELWAILCVEANRAGCGLVGEDLGTVPPAVRERMDRHGARRMYVVQFELQPDSAQPLRPIPPNSVASLNTHDTPTFEGFWHQRDIQERQERGIGAEGSDGERAQRHALTHSLYESLRRTGVVPEGGELMDVLLAVLMHLASSDAAMVLVNLEDLWLEPQPQNVPGTNTERPNWKRRARLALDRIESSAELAQLFDAISRARGTAG